MRGMWVVALATTLALAGCSAGTVAQDGAPANANNETTSVSAQAEEAAASMQVEVNGTTFTATLADTQAAEEFRALLPLTVNATELNGNEKYAALDQALSMDGASVASPIESGDIFLYGGNDVVLFYQTHDNGSWSYVPIAHIDNPVGLAEAVGSGDVTITYE